MGPYLGDYKEDATLNFKWDTNGADGASITRAVDGTIQVYKSDSVTQSLVGITNVEDFDGLTGIHLCTIDLSSDAFYAIANDYQVILALATIDGKVVNSVLASFSIENRFAEVDVVKWLGTAVTKSAANVPDVNVAQISDDTTAADNLEANIANLDATVSSRATPAQVNTEVDTALSDINLDHLLKVAALDADITNDSVIAQMVSKVSPADWSSFVNTDDALEAIRDRGDAAWITGLTKTDFVDFRNINVLTIQELANGIKIAATHEIGTGGNKKLVTTTVNANNDFVLTEVVT